MVGDIANVKAQVVIQEVLGLARVQYRLRELCQVIAMPHLVADVRTATDYTGSEKVPELVEADIKSQAYSKTSFDLWKNVVHLAISAEAGLKSDIDVLGLEVKSAAKELARMENSQIATEIEADSTAKSGSAWATGSNNPTDDIMAGADPIFDAGYEAKYLAMKHTQYVSLITNDLLAGFLERGTWVVDGKLPTVCGLKIIIDQNVTANKAYVIDPAAPAIILGEGPELAIEYGQDDPRFFKGYALAKFIEPSFVNTSACRVLTGI